MTLVEDTPLDNLPGLSNEQKWHYWKLQQARAELKHALDDAMVKLRRGADSGTTRDLTKYVDRFTTLIKNEFS